MKKDLRTDEEWKKVLTPLQFKILRQKGTEPAGYSPLNNNKEEGKYFCAACNNLLFLSGDKYDSGTGWPSFKRPAQKQSLIYDDNPKKVSSGSEVLCWRCEGHLGHVFDDGPEPKGYRFCMNGEVLKFKEGKNE